jgi:large subunit ribosomal protein L25
VPGVSGLLRRGVQVPQDKIVAEPRVEFGKGAARRIRRADKVPAVLYGHHQQPQHLTLPGHELMLALKGEGRLLSLVVDGQTVLVLPKEVQRDPIKRFIEHVDFVLVRQGERVTVEVPVRVTGQPAPDALVQVEHPQLELEVEATQIPDALEVSVAGAGPDTRITAGQVTLPAGARLVSDPDALVVHLAAAPSTAQVEAELARAEAEAGIEHPAAGGTE